MIVEVAAAAAAEGLADEDDELDGPLESGGRIPTDEVEASAVDNVEGGFGIIKVVGGREDAEVGSGSALEWGPGNKGFYFNCKIGREQFTVQFYLEVNLPPEM